MEYFSLQGKQVSPRGVMFFSQIGQTWVFRSGICSRQSLQIQTSALPQTRQEMGNKVSNIKSLILLILVCNDVIVFNQER